MSEQRKAAKEDIQAAWDFWLSQHDISVPEIIKAAIASGAESALYAWLEDHSDQVIAAIAAQAKPAQ